MLGPHQLGLAATLVLMSAFFDMVSDTGSDRFLIQDRDGDSPSAQRLVHLVYVGRGVATVAALAIMSWPIALFYGEPKLAPALAVLGFTRFIMGFLHLDMRRFQRHFDFRAEAVGVIAGEITGLVVTGLAAWLTHDFTAILYGLMARALVRVIASHVQADRPYRLGLSREHAARMTAFAVPLMFNGLLLFFATQGDRAMVGRQLGFAALGRYSAILLLAYYPMAVLQKYLSAMYLPLLAGTRDEPEQRGRTASIMGGQILMLALLMSAGFALVAPFAANLLYGRKFAIEPMIVCIIGILQTSRFLLVYPTVVALSVGRSDAALAVNVVRLVAYPAAVVGGLLLGGLPGLVAGFVFGELIAHMTGLLLLNRRLGRSVFDGFDRIAVFVLGSATLLGWVWAVERKDFTVIAALAAGSAMLIVWIARRERLAIADSLVMARGALAGLVTSRRSSLVMAPDRRGVGARPRDIDP